MGQFFVLPWQLILAVQGILTFIAGWNSFLLPLINIVDKINLQIVRNIKFPSFLGVKIKLYFINSS
jgi:ABC-type glycerol-3-phosphate transport system permease component